MLESNYQSYYCDIFIRGIELNRQQYESIVSVTLTQSMEGSDTVSISLIDTDALFIEDDIFVEDTQIKINMGCHEINEITSFEGFITTIDLDFNSAGQISLDITCSDNSFKMDRENKTKTWENKLNVDIVKEIVSSYGFKFEMLNPFSYRNYVSIAQDDMTDLQFIEKLRDEEVFPCYAKMHTPDTFCFQTITFNKPVVCNLHYMLAPYDVISFSPTINRNQLKEGRLKSEIDVVDKSLNTAQAVFGYSEALTNGLRPITSSRPSNSSYNYDGYEILGYTKSSSLRVGNDSAKLFSDAEKEMLKDSIAVLEGSLEVKVTNTTTKIKIEDTINIYGLGRYLSGMYSVKGIDRSLSSGGYSLIIHVVKTGFGDSIKSETLYTEINDPNYVPDDGSEKESTSSNEGDNSGKPNLEGAEHTTLQFTAYTHTGNATASGVMPRINHTCASWSGLPFGTKIYVPSRNCTYTVEDRGGAVTYGIIDLFMDTEAECWAFGRQNLEAYIIRV